MAYFDTFSDLLLPSFTDNRRSSNDYVKVKNLFRRGKIRDDFFQNATAFGKYTIVGDDRPDTVAEKLYGDADLDWIVLISNNILDVRNEWPISQGDFQRYLDNKYSIEQLSEVHHYETLEVVDGIGNIVLESGLEVDENFTITFNYAGEQKTLSGASLVKSVSYLEHEIAKNDEKRVIFALRKSYIQTVIDDMREIMTYTDSSQYIDKRTKKGDNLRILSPR
jgi:hypothetical protein